MSDQPLLLILATVILAAITVLLHLVLMRVFAEGVLRLRRINSLALTAAIIIAISIHLIEIGLFALGMRMLIGTGRFGQLIGIDDAARDFFYFSTVAYTTVGFGDITPEGPIRIVVAAEALTGLIMSAWTASLLFVGVQKYVNQLGSEEEFVSSA